MQTSDNYDFEWTLERLRGRVGTGCVVNVAGPSGLIAVFGGVMAEVEPRGWIGDEVGFYICQFHATPGTGYYGFVLNPATFERSWIEYHMTFVIGHAGSIQVAIEGREFEAAS